MGLKLHSNGNLVTKAGVPACDCCEYCECDPDFTDVCVYYTFSDATHTDEPGCIALSGSVCVGSFVGSDSLGDWTLAWDDGLGEWAITLDDGVGLSEGTMGGARCDPALPFVAVAGGNITDLSGNVVVGPCLDNCGCTIVWDTSAYSGQLNGDPWVTQAGGNFIRVNVEDSLDPEDCAGSNNNPQTAEAVGTITVGATALDLDLTLSGLGEEEFYNIEIMDVFVNGDLVATAHSPGTLGYGTCAMGPVAVTYLVAPPYALAANAVHTLVLEFTTGDAVYHEGAYYAARFNCTPSA